MKEYIKTIKEKSALATGETNRNTKPAPELESSESGDGYTE